MDLIKRTAEIDMGGLDADMIHLQTEQDMQGWEDGRKAHPTLCGYNIEHLILIAEMLRKENLPPERVIEVLTDIGRIVSMLTDEFEESLRNEVKQCLTLK